MYTERVKTPKELFFFFFWALRFVKVEASQGVCQCETVLRLSACVRAFALGGTNGERGSQTGQLTADSDGELHRRKSLSHRSPLFQ